MVWVTGLSGSGKSTVTARVRDRLAQSAADPVVLDGDRLRAILPVRLGYDEADRRRLAMFYARLAHEFASQGRLVLCSTISLFHEVHQWNRQNNEHYLEVWLRVPLPDLSARAGRAALYAGGTAVGAGVAAEFPTAAHLVIDNYGPTTPDAAADQIMAALADRQVPESG
ncbi:adenylyl-sulfate kinase [Actinomadura rupiterrae]|uniref:adenylyl-sulfate kinase n=1 Tax=Actinomadura rupiterrae TaxID=559627 RepID=UPI0020A304D9|nr:adenylyl-sulfate kinase [Actinomadura rupiterrae]MCP2337298.1 adenylylsulfate kinase [Actinomadura rupiterrae]